MNNPYISHVITDDGKYQNLNNNNIKKKNGNRNILSINIQVFIFKPFFHGHRKLGYIILHAIYSFIHSKSFIKTHAMNTLKIIGQETHDVTIPFIALNLVQTEVFPSLSLVISSPTFNSVSTHFGGHML
uniref:(California timema) hypothetical protein n=1 Tax=Timema californicum TaxID=61474 RepID=A0A7R9PA40_TIMCA|nr:unnamed protein product [Timema californicum]